MLNKVKLFLASSSPRRKELMSQLELDPKVVIAPVEEVALPNESPSSFVIRMAVEKAMAGYDKLSGDDIFVIGADTVVVLGGQVYGKPKNKFSALKMLSALAGKTHTVISAVAVISAGVVYFDKCSTQVRFRNLKPQEIEAYWQTGEPEGKAGSYAIQGVGARFIEEINGSYSGVMGLPLYELDQLLTQSGFYK